MPDELPVHRFADREALARWLAEHCESSRGIWLQLARKGSGQSSVTYAEAVELGLAYGWIDGQKRPLDAVHWLQRYTPRGPRSRWSRINCEKASELIEAGEMAPPGLAAVDGAKADGRWERAYEPASTITVPADLQQALDANPGAATFFATLRGNNRYAVLYRIGDAKRPETRARRIVQFVEMLARGETLH